MPKIPSLLAGVAGEYFVAGELSRRGYIASISLRNTRGIDILVTNSAGSRSVTIQCKTNQLAAAEWILNEKAESFAADNHFYAFVALSGLLERARFHIVPSLVVAEYTKANHRAWLSRPGRSGKAHAPSSIRKFADPSGAYLERWDNLGL